MENKSKEGEERRDHGYGYYYDKIIKNLKYMGS